MVDAVQDWFVGVWLCFPGENIFVGIGVRGDEMVFGIKDGIFVLEHIVVD